MIERHTALLQSLGVFSLRLFCLIKRTPCGDCMLLLNTFLYTFLTTFLARFT
jgi:hypothetical protein